MVVNRYFHSLVRIFFHEFLLIVFVLFFVSCTPTNQGLSDLTGEAVSTKNTTSTVNGPLGNSALTFSPSSYNFPTLATNAGAATQTFTVTNSSIYSVILGSLSGTTNHFTLTTNTCTNGLTLVANATCTFTVRFAPTISGPHSTAISVPYDAAGASTFSSAVSITGAGSTLTSFAGLDSLSNQTPTTMKLNWTDVVGASFYQVFTVSGGVATSVTSLLAAANCVAGACSYNAFGLTPLTNYTYRVRATDAFGVQDQNIVDRTSITTTGYLALSGNAPAKDLCSPFTITVQDATHTPVNVGTDTAITIGGAGSGATYLDSNCAFPSATPSINSGTSAKIFYFKDSSLETVTLSAALTNLTTTTKSAIVFDPLATTISLSPVSGSTSNSTSPSITLTLPANDLNLSATATIYSAAGCATAVGSAAIVSTSQAITLSLSTQTTYSFYYKISNAGSATACTNTGVTYTLDTTAPTVAITTQGAAFAVSNKNQFALTVSGTCSENTRNVSILASGQSSTSSTTITTCGGGTFSTPINISNLAEGTLTLTATHTDLAGNSSSGSAAGTGLKTTCQASTTVITTTGGITYNVPANCTYVTAEIWGAGGGSAANYTNIVNPSGGGGGYLSGMISVDTTGGLTQSFSAVVGTGGSGGTDANTGNYASAGGGGAGSGIRNTAGTINYLVAGGGGGGGGNQYVGSSGGAGGAGGGVIGGDAPAVAGNNFPGLGGVWNGAIISAGATTNGGYPSLTNGGTGVTVGAAGNAGGAGGTGLGNGGAGGGGGGAGAGGGGGGGGFYGGSGASSNANVYIAGGGGGASGSSGYIGNVSGYTISNTQASGATADVGDTTNATNDYSSNASGTAGNGGAGPAGANAAGIAGKNGLIVMRTFYDNTIPTTPPSIFIIGTASAISLTASWVAAADNVGGSGIATYQIALGSSAGATDYLTYERGSIGNVTSTVLSNFILPVSTTVYPSIRALDYNGNPSSVVNGASFVTPASFKIKLYPTLSTSSLTYNLSVPSAGMNVTVKAWGAGGGNQGGSCYNANTSGGGGFVKDTYSTSGYTFFAINVGGPGLSATRIGIGGGGGAASTIRGGTSNGLTWAGGGGGSGCQDSVTGGHGGAGGGTSGVAGSDGGIVTTGGLAGGAGTASANGAGGASGNVGGNGTGGGAIGSVGGRGGNTTAANAGGGAGVNPDAAGGQGGNGVWAWGSFGGGGGGGGYYPGGGGGTGNGSGGGGGGGSSYSVGTPTYTAGSANVPGGSPTLGNDPDYLGTTGAGTTVSQTSGSAGMVVICNAGGC